MLKSRDRNKNERDGVDGGERKRERGSEEGGVCDEYCLGVSHVVTLMDGQTDSNFNFKFNLQSHTQLNTTNVSTQHISESKNENNISLPHTQNNKNKKDIENKIETLTKKEMNGVRVDEYNESKSKSSFIKNENRIRDRPWVESSTRVLFVGDTGARTFACNEMTNMVKLPLAVSQDLLPVEFTKNGLKLSIPNGSVENSKYDTDENDVGIDEKEKIGDVKCRRNEILKNNKTIPEDDVRDNDDLKTAKMNIEINDKMKKKTGALRDSEDENVSKRGQGKCKSEIQFNNADKEREKKKAAEKKRVKRDERNCVETGGREKEKVRVRDYEAIGNEKKEEKKEENNDKEIDIEVTKEKEEEEGEKEEEVDREALQKLTPWSYQVSYSTSTVYFTILHCAALYYTILYHTLLYHTILYFAVLYYTILYNTIVN